MTAAISINGFDPNNMSAPTRAVSGIVDTGAITYDADYLNIDGKPRFARWLYVGTSGTLSYVKYNGQTETLPNLASGVWHPIWSIRINSSGSTITVDQLRWGD